MGESRDSGRNSGLDVRAKLAVISAIPERFDGESLDGVPVLRSEPEMGESNTRSK